MLVAIQRLAEAKPCLWVDAVLDGWPVDAHERDYRHISNEWKINDLSPLKIKLLQADK